MTTYYSSILLNDVKPTVDQETICKLVIRRACRALVEGELEMLDGSDGINQCHINALMIALLYQDKQFCSKL